MRKFISIFMTCTLLAITTIPSASLAAMCVLPSAESVHIETLANQHLMKDHPVHHDQAMQIMHHTDTVENSDWQTCRIECGCGCHRHIDSLPQALSPHIIPQIASLADTSAAAVAIFYSYPRHSYIPTVQTPPPNLS